MKKEEYLAMSLPHGLMCNVSTKSGYYYTLVEYKPLDYENEFTHKVLCSEPILHPLSDLKKEIEHKGERFVPIEKLGEIIGGGRCGVYDMAVELMQEWDIDTLKDKIKHLPLEFIQLFISWYFDIADLISKGEAIDVNTLETNPYK